MGSDVFAVLSMLVLYTAFIVIIGWWSTKFAKKSLEDYAMASREFKALVLFGSVFGANISAVTLIGIPGGAYHRGWIMWPYFVTAWAWLTPLLFYVLGSRAWVIAQKYGYMTISEMIGGRWKSKPLAYITGIILLVYTVPYLMTGLQGGAVTLEVLTGGLIPYWLGALIVTVVVVYYLLVGGMRGAAWVNTFQTAVFLIGGLSIFLIVAHVLGGPAESTRAVAEKYPELLNRSKMPWQVFFSYGIIVSFAVALFPQVFMRLLTGRNPRSLKQMALIYPLGGFLIFFAMAYVGMWGKPIFPNLKGVESDGILPMLLANFTSPWVTGILGAAVFAALMSTMDSQLMAATTIIVKDFLVRKKESLSEEKTVLMARLMVLLLAVVSYILALGKFAGIIKIIEFAFAGFALLWVPMFGALFWQRCTRQAALISMIVSQAVLIALTVGWLPKSLCFGMLPGVPAMALGFVLLVAVSYLTPAPAAETKEYFRVIRESYEGGREVQAAGSPPAGSPAAN
ncbi:MAG: sodium:solute symporter family protein [Peptococcaceae bacterium]|nr:sodium:solute symporter family protein [Peptococcaceae bacterium]